MKGIWNLIKLFFKIPFLRPFLKCAVAGILGISVTLYLWKVEKITALRETPLNIKVGVPF